MEVLVTGAASDLGQQVAAALGKEHRLRLLDSSDFPVPAKAEGVRGSLLEADDAWRAVRGVQAVVHTGAPPADLPAAGVAREQALLDWYTRGTHVLLQASVEAGVRRCVYLSTLEVFRQYPDDVYISENWRPEPAPELDVLGPYLGESVCREFASDYRIGITALRLGRLMYEEAAGSQTPDLMWLDPRDAAQACACALRADLSQEVHSARRWRVLHVCAQIANAKFLIEPARATGYAPEHNFTALWGGGGE
jgi:hypothetical protein